MLMIRLFLSFFKIGLFSFGGGYAAIPLIQSEISRFGWLTLREFSDLVTISQMTPGPIAINSATFIGIKVGGILGAMVATLGNILPSCLIVTLITYLYLKYHQLETLQKVLMALRPAVVSLIAMAGVSIFTNAIFPEGINDLAVSNLQLFIILIISLFLLLKQKMNPILVMVLSGVLNVVYYLLIT